MDPVKYDPLNKTIAAMEIAMHLACEMGVCKTERNEATSPAERMFHDGRLLLLHELDHWLVVAPAAPEPPKKAGRWEFENGIGDYAAGERTVPCSECHTRQFIQFLDHYCPHCGVYMPTLPRDGEVENGV